MVPDHQRDIRLRLSVFVLRYIEGILAGQSCIGDLFAFCFIQDACELFGDVCLLEEYGRILLKDDFPRCRDAVGIHGEAVVAERFDLHVDGVAFDLYFNAVILIRDADTAVHIEVTGMTVVLYVEVCCGHVCDLFGIVDFDVECEGFHAAVADSCIGKNRFDLQGIRVFLNVFADLLEEPVHRCAFTGIVEDMYPVPVEDLTVERCGADADVCHFLIGEDLDHVVVIAHSREGIVHCL